MILASAPGRCGLVGNPTDMYGGSVLSLSTRERAHCTLSRDTDALDNHGLGAVAGSPLSR